MSRCGVNVVTLLGNNHPQISFIMSLLERKRGTGGKFKKNSQKEKDLSLEDLNFLKKNTALGEKEIREWYR